jgi:predicted ATPase
MVRSSSSTAKNKQKLKQGITSISVQGYKSLYEECNIEIRPLTILAGANSSGKSSIMQLLLMMKQTLESTYDPGSLLLNGPNVRFTLAQQMFSKISGQPKVKEISIKIGIDNALITDIFNSSSKGIELKNMIIKNDSTILNLSSIIEKEEVIQFIKNNLPPNIYENFIKKMKIDLEKITYEITRDRCFFKLVCKAGDFVGIDVTLLDMNPYIDSIKPHINKLIHVPGLRGNPERSYNTTAVGDKFPGTFENYVASIIYDWQINRDRRLTELGKALETLNLTSKVGARKIDDTQVELRVSRLSSKDKKSSKDMVSIADVGFGVSQTLPVLVALLVAEPEQLVYIEQPEIHLHPRAQVALAEILADAAKRGVRVVIETHSELLLLSIQSLVAEGKLSPDIVKLHWFVRQSDGSTKVSSADLDETGAFGDWPEDFDDVSMKLQSRYLDAAEEKLWKRSHGE